MITRISEAEAKAKIGDNLPDDNRCDYEFCKQYFWHLSDTETIEYCMDEDEDGFKDERWNLIDSRPLTRIAE